MSAPWYCTRESVKAALDVAETARVNPQIDRLIAAASRNIEGLTHRQFYPEVGTRYFAWPDDQLGTSWRLWLDQHELVALDTIVSDGVEVTEYFLEPQSGPPYNRVELDLAGDGSFGGGDTFQRSIAITGTWCGAPLAERDGGQLAASASSGAATVEVTDAAAVGVGDLLRIGTERMIVTGRRQTPTGQQLDGALGAGKGETVVAVTDGTAFRLDEVLLVDGERMRVVDIAADRLIVERAADGSVLAAHDDAAPIYAPRLLAVSRGVLGTTAAAHSSGAAVAVHDVPEPVRSLAIAEVLWALQMETSGYARVVGAGENARQVSASGLRSAREDVRTSHGRKARKRAI